MIFLFKKREITVDCFITNPTAYELYPVSKSSDFFPEGWKKLPRSKMIKIHGDRHPESKLDVEMATAKKCIGLINLFSSGFIIPAWCDFGIEIKPDGKPMWYAHGDMIVDQHPSWQVWDDFYKGYGHAKIASPWVLREKSGVKFTWNQCDWHNTHQVDRFKTLSGVIDYKYQQQTNINMFIKRDCTINFKGGDPLVHLIPISDRDVKIKTHLVTHDEIIKLNPNPAHFINQYNTTKRIRDKNEKSKCPFGFGK